MKWNKKNGHMAKLANDLLVQTHTMTHLIDKMFGTYEAGVAAVGHVLGRFIVQMQDGYDMHRQDCKHCGSRPLDFRAIFLANFNDAGKEEKAEAAATRAAGESAASSFLDRVLANHDSNKPKEAFKDPKAK